MYDFDGDYETVFTGTDDVRKSGLIDTYRGSTDLPQWNGKHCSNVQYASDGTKFMGGVAKNESIIFYRKSLCRAAPLVRLFFFNLFTLATLTICVARVRSMNRERVMIRHE